MLTSNTYKDLKSTAGETKDCTVLALALVLNISYPAAHEAMAVAGRAARDGLPRDGMRTALKALGFRVRRVWRPEDLAVQTGTRQVDTASPLENPEMWALVPDMLIFTYGHVGAWVNGRVEDWSGEMHVPIQEAWELERADVKTVRLGVEPPPVIYLRGR